MALRRPPGRSRSRWFANYVDLVVDKDVMDISRVRQREMLPRLLGQLAARSGQVLNITPVAGAIGLERSTAENYLKLLEAVFLVHRLPAWGTTLGSRVVKHPKVHILDSGVMAWLLKPELFTSRDVNVSVECESELTMGMTVIEWWRVTDRPRNATVCRSVNADGFFQLLTERIATLS